MKNKNNKNKCDFCEKNDLELVYSPLTSERNSKIYVCSSCGLVQSLPRILNVAEKKISISSGANWGNLRYGKIFRTNICIESLIKYLDFKNHLNILDVGSSRGDFVKKISEYSSNIFVTAVEPDNIIAENFNKNINVKFINDRIENINFPDNEFDLIHSCHTLEHLFSPYSTFKEHYRNLKCNGILIIDIPNIELINNSDMIEEWFIDKHLYHFSIVTILNYVRKIGFEVIQYPNLNDKENILLLLQKNIKNKPSMEYKSDYFNALNCIKRYKKNILSNKLNIVKVSKFITELSKNKIIIWGAGRLFDSLVKLGKFNFNSNIKLVDNYLINYVDSVNGVKLNKQEIIDDFKPSYIIIMSRSFVEEITLEAKKIAPNAQIFTYNELMKRAQ